MENVLLQWDWGGSKGSNPSIGLLNWLSWFLTISCCTYNDTSHRRYRKWCSSFWSWCRRLKISSSILLVSSSDLLPWLRSWTKAFLKESQVRNLGTHLLQTRKSDWQDSVHSALERSTTVMLGITTTSWPQNNRPYCDLFLQPEFRCIWIHQTNCLPPRHLCSWFSGYKALSMLSFTWLNPSDSLILVHLWKCKSLSHVVLPSYACGEKSSSFRNSTRSLEQKDTSK